MFSIWRLFPRLPKTTRVEFSSYELSSIKPNQIVLQNEYILKEWMEMTIKLLLKFWFTISNNSTSGNRCFDETNLWWYGILRMRCAKHFCQAQAKISSLYLILNLKNQNSIFDFFLLFFLAYVFILFLQADKGKWLNLPFHRSSTHAYWATSMC